MKLGAANWGREAQRSGGLRLGRVMLYYQTPNGHESGYWNAQTRTWLPLDSSVRRPLKKALAIARQQTSGDWLTLPVKTLAQEVQP